VSLQLFGHPFSSYTQKVLIALYADGTEFEYRILEREHPETGPPTREIGDVVAEHEAEGGHDHQADEVGLGCQEGRREDQDDATGERNPDGFDERRPEDDAVGVIRQEIEVRLDDIHAVRLGAAPQPRIERVP